MVPVERVRVKHADLRCRGSPEALQDLDRRRLAGPVRPKEHDHLARANPERHLTQDLEGAVTHAQTLDADDGVAAGSLRAHRPAAA
jgi:hypothetical protein